MFSALEAAILRINWLIGGAQGTGVDTAASIFGAAVARAGYYVFGSREYFSNIKGRHSYFNAVLSEKVQHSIDTKVDILTAFDAETVFQHFDDVKGVMVYDKAHEPVEIGKIRSMEPELLKRQVAVLERAGHGTTISDIVKYLGGRGVKTVPVDYGALMRNIMNELKTDPLLAERARNIICVGASFALLGLDAGHLNDSITQAFSNKQAFIKLNILAAQAGIGSASDLYSLKELPKTGHRVQFDGNTFSALGKLSAGLRFQSYYPITPASDESTYIEENQLLRAKAGETQGAVVVQTEDEIAAINAAVGAALTGARSATATSGPGFSLMNEGISWAGMNEVPVVVTYYMRGAPSTGLPTRSGQSDLKLALNAGHGEFPRIVLASGDHGEVFSDAALAMNLAEMCQTPAIHIVEKCIANSYSVVDEESMYSNKVKIERGEIVYPEDPEHYKRFAFSDSGISPRAFLGHAQMYYTGDEHNEYGHIAEESSNRTAMYEKRMKKLGHAAKYLADEQQARVVGDADTVLLTWGSPKGAIIDALEELENGGVAAEMIQVRVFSPYPAGIMAKALEGKKRVIAVENNYNAQGAETLTERTGIKPTNYILKWNGRPIARDELIDAVKDIAENNTKRVVLDGGK